jgi:1-aminocyclopropane-1-carboxylate synthase
MALSSRGEKASNTVLRVDMDIFFEAMQNLYDAENNPNGTFPLNVAENRLTWDMLNDKIQHITQNHKAPEWVAGYTSGQGAPPFREAVAKFLSQFLTGCEIHPSHIACSAGATSVIELTSYVLGEVGDVAAFPAPSYPVYKQDIGNVSQLERYDIHTHHDLSELQNGSLLTIAHLEKAKQDIENQGKRFRILVLTTPDNPTGIIYTTSQLQVIADWCIQHKIHLVVNEIYGLSLIDTQHPVIQEDYNEHFEFSSFAKIMQERKSEYLHYWYAFSKDFGISGFRVGLVYSLNEQLIKAYENLNYTRLVSNYTQWILQQVLEDTNFVERYIKTNQERLTQSYVEVVKTLKKLQIPYVPSRGSLFIWLDMSHYLKANTQEAENELWLDFYQKTGILLTPGDGFGHTKKGHFRMVFPFISKTNLKVAMQRFVDYS